MDFYSKYYNMCLRKIQGTLDSSDQSLKDHLLAYNYTQDHTGTGRITHSNNPQFVMSSVECDALTFCYGADKADLFTQIDNKFPGESVIVGDF